MCGTIIDRLGTYQGLSTVAPGGECGLKGITLYPEDTRHGTKWWTVPPEERVGVLSDADWSGATDDQRNASIELNSKLVFEDRDIPRDDQALVAVVEELGVEANGCLASLKVAEVGFRCRIDEYNGAEIVVTVDEYGFSVAPIEAFQERVKEKLRDGSESLRCVEDLTYTA